MHLQAWHALFTRYDCFPSLRCSLPCTEVACSTVRNNHTAAPWCKEKNGAFDFDLNTKTSPAGDCKAAGDKSAGADESR